MVIDWKLFSWKQSGLKEKRLLVRDRSKLHKPTIHKSSLKVVNRVSGLSNIVSLF
jgi:hypothetical protein